MHVELPSVALTERVRGCCLPVAPLLASNDIDRLSALLKAVGDPARLQILHMLRAAGEPVCVCDLTAALDVGQPTVSHHLARLKEAGLVTSKKLGVWAYYSLRTDASPEVQSVLALVP
ncbi:MAG TPA: metalloregulator ArsR/SmtB family transcription factor, partial [Chloroflexota bacterium]